MSDLIPEISILLTVKGFGFILLEETPFKDIPESASWPQVAAEMGYERFSLDYLRMWKRLKVVGSDNYVPSLTTFYQPTLVNPDPANNSDAPTVFRSLKRARVENQEIIENRKVRFLRTLRDLLVQNYYLFNII